jgi:hypothetical protein
MTREDQQMVKRPKAMVGPTGHGTFGIIWRDFPAMERRGGYSGPYNTLEDARQAALEWADAWGYAPYELTIRKVENVNRE